MIRIRNILHNWACLPELIASHTNELEDLRSILATQGHELSRIANHLYEPTDPQTWVSCILFGESIPRREAPEDPEEPEDEPIIRQGPRPTARNKPAPFLMAAGGYILSNGVPMMLEFPIMQTARLRFVCLEGDAQIASVFVGTNLLYNGSGIRWFGVDQVVLPGVIVRVTAVAKEQQRWLTPSPCDK